MATYAVGDLQGCLDPLKILLDEVNFDTARDRLWLAGDVVNRGPQSLEALRFVKNLGKNAIMVLGNHDLHLLAYASGFREPGKLDTLSPILKATDCNELIDWLHQQPLMHYDKKKNIAMVHAGIPPLWSIKKALKRAQEVEKHLRNEKKSIRFLKNMYGNLPDTWNGALEGQERLRLITNYFTRMRFCSDEGQLELKTKQTPDNPPKGFAPWYRLANSKLGETKIIFGHWAALMGKTNNKQFIALDTGYYWGGYLSMMRLEDETLFRTPAV